MPFGRYTCGVLWQIVLGGVSDSQGKGIFGGRTPWQTFPKLLWTCYYNCCCLRFFIFGVSLRQPRFLIISILVTVRRDIKPFVEFSLTSEAFHQNKITAIICGVNARLVLVVSVAGKRHQTTEGKLRLHRLRTTTQPNNLISQFKV